MKHKVLGCAIAALLVYSGTASATVVNSASGPVTVDWSENVTSGGVSATLSGDLVLSNFNFTGLNSVTFSVFVANDTQQGTLTAAQLASIRLTSFGFDTDPDATTVSDTSVTFDTTLDTTLPGFGQVDVCAWAGNNCAGGSNEGLIPGQSATFNITLSGFSSDITSLDLGIGPTEEFGVKFQTAFGSFEFSNPPGPPPPPPPAVPEPASLVLLGTGILGLAGALRYRRRK